MNMMELKPLIDEIEEIKARLFMLEVKLIEMENPEKEDIEAVAQALKEFREGKTGSSERVFKHSTTLVL